MSLSDSLAELAELSQQQQGQAPIVPPPGSPGRPNIDLYPAPPKAGGQAPKAAPSLGSRVSSAIEAASSYLAGGAVTAANKVAPAIPAAILRAPGQIAGGTLDTLADADKWLTDNIHPAFVRQAIQNSPGVGTALQAGAAARQANGGASLADTLSMRASLGQWGDPGINQGMTQAASIGASLLTPGGEAKGAQLLTSKVAQLLTSSAKVGLATGITADTTGSENPLADRAKEAAAGAAVNVVAEPLLGLIGNYIKGKVPTKIVQGSPEDALSDRLDRGFASARTTEARYQAQEAQGKTDASEATPSDQAVLQQGTRVSDAPSGGAASGSPSGDRSQGKPGASADTASVAPGGDGDLGPYRDAQTALDQSGAAEKLDPATHPVQADGTIPVEPATKAAADEAGLGRAFQANADEGAPKDSVIFKEEDGEGGSRVVGVIDRESLQGFKDDVEANRFDAESPTDTTSAHPVGQWKLSPLGASYDVGPFLRALADQLPPREALTDAEVMQSAKANADAIGWNPEDMVAYAASVAGDASKMPEVMATIRTVYARAASMVDSMVDAKTDWSAVPVGSSSLKEALLAVHNVSTLGKAVAEFKSGVGGALRIAGMPDADAYVEGFGKTAVEDLKPVDPLQGLPPLPRNADELKQWLDVWNYTKDDPTTRAMFIQRLNFMPSAWMAVRNSMANWFTAGIISAPATFLRDVMGPAIIGGLRTLERTGGGYASAFGNPFLDQATKQDLLRTAQQAPSAYFQTIGATADALKAAVKAVQSGGQLLQPHGIYDLRTRAIPDALIEAATGKPPGLLNAQSYPYIFANVVNAFPGWIHALHGGVNEFAQRLSYLGEVRAGAMLDGAQQGLAGDDLVAHVREVLQNSTDEVTFAGRDQAALASSQRTTLIKPVGDGGEVATAFNKFITQLRTDWPETRYVLPIFTVPANALGEAIRRTPVGFLFRETQQELSGSLGAARQAEAYGRMMSGAALLTGGLAMARAGVLTGPGPTDPRGRAAWEGEGFQPYSIRIGGKWISYVRMDVIGNLLAIPASMFDRSVHTQLDNESAAYASVAGLAQYFKDQAAMQGVADLMSFGGSPQEAQGYLQKLVDRTAGGFVPNFITQLGRNNVDPERRVVRNPWEAVLDKLPGASLYLDPQRNPLGEPTNKIMNVGGGVLPVSVTSANTYAKDPVADELDRLYQATGYAPGLKSPALPGGHEDMRDIKLEDGSSMYDALMRYRGQVTDDSGQKIRSALQSLFDSPEYNAAVDGDARNLRTTNGDMDRGAMVQQLFHQFDTQAQHEVASASPIAARYLALGEIKRGNNAFLRDTPTRDLATNPALLKSLGINLQDFEDKVRGQ